MVSPEQKENNQAVGRVNRSINSLESLIYSSGLRGTRWCRYCWSSDRAGFRVAAVGPSGNVHPLLCRPLDYADHWPRTGSGGGDRCVGVGIITVPPEMREACRSVENARAWLPLELSRLVRVP